jgi:hypothetical protein
MANPRFKKTTIDSTPIQSGINHLVFHVIRAINKLVLAEQQQRHL